MLVSISCCSGGKCRFRLGEETGSKDTKKKKKEKSMLPKGFLVREEGSEKNGCGELTFVTFPGFRRCGCADLRWDFVQFQHQLLHLLEQRVGTFLILSLERSFLRIIGAFPFQHGSSPRTTTSLLTSKRIHGQTPNSRCCNVQLEHVE